MKFTSSALLAAASAPAYSVDASSTKDLSNADTTKPGVRNVVSSSSTATADNNDKEKAASIELLKVAEAEMARQEMEAKRDMNRALQDNDLFSYDIGTCLEILEDCKLLTNETEGGKRTYPFQKGEFEYQPSAERIRTIVHDLEGSFDGRFYEAPNFRLSQKECTNLIQYADHTHAKAVAGEQTGIVSVFNSTDDFLFPMTPRQLVSLTSPESVQTLHRLFKDFENRGHPIDQIRLRRTTMDMDRHVKYHIDGKVTVMHVHLNGKDMEGGNLHYLTRDGVVVTNAGTGAVIMHNDNIVHGVSPFDGTRYILLLLGSFSKHGEDIIAEDMVTNRADYSSIQSEL